MFIIKIKKKQVVSFLNPYVPKSKKNNLKTR